MAAAFPANLEPPLPVSNSDNNVPLIDVPGQNEPLLDDLVEAAARVIRSGQFILGPELDRFESQMAESLGVAHALGVSSGTDALLLGLHALGVGPGDEVLCPSFTFFATAGCIARTGARPVFTDVCPVCFNIDLDSARARLTERTKAIVPVHLFGQSADMDGVIGLAQECGAVVLEDGAQAIGAKYKGRACGTIGDFGAFSFFPTKNLGGFGDSGLLVTNDDELAAVAKRMRVHGMEPKYHHVDIGGNFRMDALQAALLAVKAPHQDAYNAARRENAAYYHEKLGGLPGVEIANPAHCRCAAQQAAALSEAGTKIVLPVAYDHNEHIWNQYTIRVLGEGRRDALREALGAAGIGSEVYYPIPVHRQECFAGLDPEPLPVAERLAAEVLSLPIFPELTRAQQDRVVTAIATFLA